MKSLQSSDILDTIHSQISVQSYQGKQKIADLEIADVRQFSGEDGTFSELMRIDEKGHLEAFPQFQIKQINRSKLLAGAIKAWHLHFNQEDIWFVAPEDHMLLGLWDLRSDSPTADMTMKIPLGAGSSKLIYIPRGVAHGVVNIADTPGTIFYYVNQHFSATNPDERRLPWDACGADFWEPEKA